MDQKVQNHLATANRNQAKEEVKVAPVKKIPLNNPVI
jgi:hypothetical protein